MKTLNLNKLLLSLSHVLDLTEKNLIGGMTNHSRRVAYISLGVSRHLRLSEDECFDIVVLAIFHDNGLSEMPFEIHKHHNLTRRRKYLEQFKDHCIIGEKNAEGFPLLTNPKNIIKYHHEKYDGTGYFGLKGDEIPLMAQIISFADNLDNHFDLHRGFRQNKEQVEQYLEARRDKCFQGKLVDAFYKVTDLTGFHMDLKDPLISQAISRVMPQMKRSLECEKIREITKVLSRIIDYKSHFTSSHSSGLSSKAGVMADFYGKGHDEKIRLLIAADLHDLGKLTIPKEIIDKKGSLTDEEFTTIKTHVYYTRICLESIEGFEEITRWAANHHEKLDGSGYPYGLTGDYLDFNSRLMACLDIYQALTEDRPYREGFTHEDSMGILEDMGSEGLIDQTIVKDIDSVFG